MIQVDLGGHSPFPLNQHSSPMVLINNDTHPLDGKWNVMSSSFVTYIHHVMTSYWSYVHAYNIALMLWIPLELCS
jgi:hypothetical protein